MAGGISSFRGIKGVLPGHSVSREGLTGVSLFVFPEGASGAVSVNGFASGTRQIDSLFPHHTVDRIHGILISGGSIFGHESASPVVKTLSREKIGLDTGTLYLPVVPGGVIFDLSFPENREVDFMALGEDAVADALSDRGGEKCQGAGAGATVGNLKGLEYATKTGRGSSIREVSGYHVGVMVILNAFGDVLNDSGKTVAGLRKEEGAEFSDTCAHFRQGFTREPFLTDENTTITLVATDGAMSRKDLGIVAKMTHTVLARYIRPYGSLFDGDTIFAVSTGKSKPVENLMQFATVTGAILYDALMDAVFSAESAGGVPCGREMKKRGG